MTRFAEMGAATNYSFLRGASSPQDMVLKALLLGYEGIGIADRNTVAGVVRAYAALCDLREEGLPGQEKIREGGSPGEFRWQAHSAEAGLDAAFVKDAALRFKLAVGTRFAFTDGTPDILAYPEDRDGWARICRLLTLGNMRGQKGECLLHRADLLADTRGLLLIAMPPPAGGDETYLGALREAAAGRLWLGARMPRQGDDRRRLSQLLRTGTRFRIPLIATNDALYASLEARDLQDILTCIREGTTIAAAGRRLEANAERHLLHPGEMARLFTGLPEAVSESVDLLARIDFSLGQLKYEYPDEPVPPGWEAQPWLEKLTWSCAEIRYPDGIPAKVSGLLIEELALIEKLDYARYFLTIYDLVRFAENKRILCQGRGSAANSAVCYVLGITAIDPGEHEVLFARFISTERKEPPDIDVDFEHERREEVIQHIYEKYGRHRAGIAATVISYRSRSAIRDVGKALGLSDDVTARIANLQWGSWDEITGAQVTQSGLEPGNPVIERAIRLAQRLKGFPRHLSQHVGGFVLARGRLDEMVPIGNAAMEKRTFIEWNKDDIDALGLMKVDVLALGMLTCIRKAFDLMEAHEKRPMRLYDVPQNDAATYDMLCAGDSIGVFQVESRAQINMLPRLKPRKLYDLVVQVAIVRPGPIQGNMVHPYLKRRNMEEEVVYPAPAPEHGPPDELHKVLGETMGVPLFQEQAMRLAIVAAKFTDAEANGLRRAMATFRNVGTIGKYERKFVDGMSARGYDPEFAQRCFDQIKGFGSYGFPESHAASFALLAYASSWIKRHHPAAFACALLNSQPMGFYAPAQIVQDAREHGVEVLPADVAASHWDNTLEGVRETGGDPPPRLRLGFRQIDGFSEAWAAAIVTARDAAPIHDVERLQRVAALPAKAMRLLADADALRSTGLDRHDGLWAVRRLPGSESLPLFAASAAQELGVEEDARLPVMELGEHIVADYQMTRLSLKGHPMQLLRARMRAERILSCVEANGAKDGARVRVAGVVLVRQRPGKGNAIFITLEDETGIVNALLWARQFEQFRRDVMMARLMVVTGRIQRSKEGVVHLMAEHIAERNDDLDTLSEAHLASIELTRADEFAHPRAPRGRHPRDARVVVKSRDFH
ncbi:MAG: error-prone DNA polymerase [Micropepsaceae bacterium]